MCAIRQEYDKFEWCNQHKYDNVGTPKKALLKEKALK